VTVKPRLVAVPDLTGMPREEAESYLIDMGLTPGECKGCQVSTFDNWK